MSWRTVVISSRAKLDLKLNYMVIRTEEVKKVFLSEIGVLIIESTAVSLTAALLSELVKRRIKVIFCDEKRNPVSELTGYYGSHDTSLKMKKQTMWNEDIKGEVWTEIIRNKIYQQKKHLLDRGYLKEVSMLEEYIKQIEFYDEGNREGHAAKVYFNAIFGMSFTRTSECAINKALNYSYSIILSLFNREIVSNGYCTQLGIFHDNMFNPFNLSSDLMEPFRILVDRKVLSMDIDDINGFSKMELVNIINSEVIIDGRKNYLNNAIKIYTKSVFDALNENDVSLIRFYEYEL